MSKRPGQIKVTVETGYCPFCFRVRNLRREERHLGSLVRTIVACESCHRTLSSTIGVAGVDGPSTAEVASPEAADAAAAAPATDTPGAPATREPKAKPAKRAAATRPQPASARPASKAPRTRATKTK
jgi:hypothetical protein